MCIINGKQAGVKSILDDDPWKNKKLLGNTLLQLGKVFTITCVAP